MQLLCNRCLRVLRPSLGNIMHLGRETIVHHKYHRLGTALHVQFLWGREGESMSRRWQQLHSVITYDLAIIAEIQVQDASTIIRRTLKLIECELPQLRLGAVARCRRQCGGRGRGRGKATAIVQEESTIYMHNQLTLPALVQAAEREFALQIHRLM